MNNNEIKSVYDPKVVYAKRLDSANKLLERFKKEKDLVYVDKSKTFFGVKNSDKKNVGYYAVQRIRKPKKDNEDLSEITYGCNCFDYVNILEHNPDHKCKHVILVEKLIQQKAKIEVKDLSALLMEDKQ